MRWTKCERAAKHSCNWRLDIFKSSLLFFFFTSQSSQQWANGLNQTAGTTLHSFISRVSTCRVYFQLLFAGLLVSYALDWTTEYIFWQVSCGVSFWHLRLVFLVKKTTTVCRITVQTIFCSFRTRGITKLQGDIIDVKMKPSSFVISDLSFLFLLHVQLTSWRSQEAGNSLHSAFCLGSG